MIATVAALVDHGLVRRVGTEDAPRFTLTRDDSRVWSPAIGGARRTGRHPGGACGVVSWP